MSKSNYDPHVEIFEWPDRFLVEASEGDGEWEKLFGVPDPDPLAPYLVDLDHLENGCCGCRNFYVDVWPNLDKPGYPRDCKHIRKAREFRDKINSGIKQLPPALKFK